MKSNSESAGAARARENDKEEFVNRKLIRPSLQSADARPETRATNGERAVRPEKNGRSSAKLTSGEQTHAETFYFHKQVQSKTVMTLVLKNGETVSGIIEWYDKNCLKISRSGKPNLLIYKPGIRYMYKSSEEGHK